LGRQISKIEFFIPVFTIIADIASVFSAYILSYYIRFDPSFSSVFPVDKGISGLYGYIIICFITIPVWLLTFQSNRMYRLNRSVFVFDEFFVIMKCATLSIVFSIGVMFFFREFPYSRIIFVLIWFFSMPFITMGRYIMLKVEKTLYNKRRGVKNVAVIGSNEMAQKVYSKFNKDKFTGFNVLGYFVKDKSKTIGNNDFVKLGEYETLPDKIRQLSIEKLLVSLDTSEHNDLYELMELCEGINVEFMLIPDFIDLMTSRIKVAEVDGVPFIKLKSIPMNLWNRMVKRIFDIVMSLLLLILASPLMILTVVLIKLTSKGPVFYNQERASLDGQKFNMIKFRSMKIDAEASGPKFASEDDGRNTPIGKYLRKFSIDEIPQFINVLKGDMSIVGPRPEREFFIQQLKEQVHRYLERHRVKCGVTGWAQVNGLRGSNSSLQTRIDYDIYYIENWSLAFDTKIIIKTIKEVLYSKDAF